MFLSSLLQTICLCSFQTFFSSFFAIWAPVSTCGRGRFFEMWLFQKVALKLCDWLHSETIKSGKLKKRADWWWGGRMLASLPFLHLFGRQRSSYLSIWQPRTNVFFKQCKNVYSSQQQRWHLGRGLGEGHSWNSQLLLLRHVSHMPGIQKNMKLCLESGGISWERVSKNSRSQPLPGMKVSHSRPWNSGMDLFYSLSVHNF